MKKGLTDNPAVNNIIEKLNQGNIREGKPLITKETLDACFDNYDPSEIERAYLKQKPSFLKLISIRFRYYLMKLKR